MKKIVGLDVGTASIGWALVHEKNNKEISEIIKTGVRIISLTADEGADFEKGKPVSINAERTLKRGMRRNIDRYQLRRKNLIEALKKSKIIDDNTVLAEQGKGTTHSLLALRSRAAAEKISLAEFARVLLAINKKRGYKSNRKAKDEEDGIAIDGMDVTKKLYQENLTPGQYVYQLLEDDKKHIPDFYRSDLQNELDKIWATQKGFYPEQLTDQLKENLRDKNKGQVWKICEKPFGIEGIKRKEKSKEQKKENYKWRTEALSRQLNLEELIIVLQEINGQINNSSGLLGKISDRSKELYFNQQTVGQYLYNQIEKNKHACLTNQVFYRQDYLDEFNKVWEIQSKFYPSKLTDQLKENIRDRVIFYQRRLKSQKGLISICELEGRKAEVEQGDGSKKIKTIGPRVIPKSSPLFQEFKIWQVLNNLEFKNVETRQKISIQEEDTALEVRSRLFEELNVSGKLTAGQVLKLTFNKPKEWELNYQKGVEGNNTNQALYKAYQSILALSGHENIAVTDKKAIAQVFDAMNINSAILDFNTDLGQEFDKQASYQLWHLLYSYEGDNSRTGNDKLFLHLKEKFGFEKEYAQVLVNIAFQSEYGSLSAKAIRKILPYLKAGHIYSEACALAGYNHSHSITKEENKQRKLKESLALLPKNSLRNPVVEKILNQMVNVFNAIVKEYGKPDEVRIELARSLKKSAKERKEMTENILKATNAHDAVRKELAMLYPFNGGARITKNDIIKYKLYEELATNGYKTLYTAAPIPKEKLFSREFDIEHIIPQAVLFDDSFSNKTLSTRKFNHWKGNRTGIDAVTANYGGSSAGVEQYENNVKKLYDEKKISSAKYKKLMMKGTEIPDGFIERDLRNTQYIAKKACQMLLEVVSCVTPVTGTITSKLREDWQLIDVMRELNWDKYNKAGLTEYQINKEGKSIPVIKNWTKRNDHRHHAMDALTVAFTKHNHVQYFNYLNARSDESHKQHTNIFAIEQKETFVSDKGKRLIKPPIPINEFRAEAKKHLQSTLVSFKAKNKVATINKNKIKGCDKPQIALTPRGQLHGETIYGRSTYYKTKYEKVGLKFDTTRIKLVAKKSYREALLKRLLEFDSNPKKAFCGKNALSKNPIYLDEHQLIKLPEKVQLTREAIKFTIRKKVASDLKIDKVVDVGIKKRLMSRYQEFDNDTKKAFANLDGNPIWLNEKKGIQIKRVTIAGVSKAEPLHYKKDHHGRQLLDNKGDPIPVDYTSLGNNHHMAIYSDKEGDLHGEIVSFYEAVIRKNRGLSIIVKQHPAHPDWEFLYTIKKNEYFVFPNKKTGFDPNAIDLLADKNHHLISPNLFRVRKIAEKQYNFLHHLETKVTISEQKNGTLIDVDIEKYAGLRGVSWERIQSTKKLKGLVKVRINHIGNIVKIGE